MKCKSKFRCCTLLSNYVLIKLRFAVKCSILIGKIGTVHDSSSDKTYCVQMHGPYVRTLNPLLNCSCSQWPPEAN